MANSLDFFFSHITHLEMKKPTTQSRSLKPQDHEKGSLIKQETGSYNSTLAKHRRIKRELNTTNISKD